MKYVIEKQGDMYMLYSVVETNFGGPAKNFVRASSNKKLLEQTILQLQQISETKKLWD